MEQIWNGKKERRKGVKKKEEEKNCFSLFFSASLHI
jgi:hypothetical protein